MVFWKSRIYPFCVALLIPALVSCANNKFKLSDRQLSAKMRDATQDYTGRINANGKIYDGYTLAIVGDSLEWYDAPNQSGKRHTSDVHKVDAVTIRHPHTLWPYLFPVGGFFFGLGVGVEVESF